MILLSDKTTISTMTGNYTTYPLLISLANINMEFHMKGSNCTFLLLALLSVPKFIHKNRDVCGVLHNWLTHECLDFVLKLLKTAASDPLRNLQYCFTPLAAFIIDTPEAQMLAGVGGKMLPITMVFYNQFGDPFGHEPHTASTTMVQLASIIPLADPADLNYTQEAKKHCLNGVHASFWRDWALTEPLTFLTPKPLHNGHHKFWDLTFDSLSYSLALAIDTSKQASSCYRLQGRVIMISSVILSALSLMLHQKSSS